MSYHCKLTVAKDALLETEIRKYKDKGIGNLVPMPLFNVNIQRCLKFIW